MGLGRYIEKRFKAVWGRYDEYPARYYYSPADFPAITASPRDTAGRYGTLKGWIYSYGPADTDDIIIFDHGIGGGHLAYFREIEYLASKGYTVFSYDHTGCAESGGDGIGCFSQALDDLHRVIVSLEEDGVMIRAVIGHSWGGYAAMNIPAVHPEIRKVVSLAGFLSSATLTDQYLPFIVKRYTERIVDMERAMNPSYADLDPRDIYGKSSSSLLYIQSSDDVTVKYDHAGALLKERFSDPSNVTVRIVEGHGHHPQRTVRAAAEDDVMKKALEKGMKNGTLDTEAGQSAFRDRFDWETITSQDEKVWKMVLDFVKN